MEENILINNKIEDSIQFDEIDTKATGRRIKFLAQNSGFSQPD